MPLWWAWILLYFKPRQAMQYYYNNINELATYRPSNYVACIENKTYPTPYVPLNLRNIIVNQDTKKVGIACWINILVNTYIRPAMSFLKPWYNHFRHCNEEPGSGILQPGEWKLCKVLGKLLFSVGWQQVYLPLSHLQWSLTPYRSKGTKKIHHFFR